MHIPLRYKAGPVINSIIGHCCLVGQCHWKGSLMVYQARSKYQHIYGNFMNLNS